MLVSRKSKYYVSFRDKKYWIDPIILFDSYVNI